MHNAISYLYIVFDITIIMLQIGKIKHGIHSERLIHHIKDVEGKYKMKSLV